MSEELRCSFCNKSQRYVEKLVAGPGVNICCECVEICADVLEDAPPGVTDALDAAATCSLCRMPAPAEHMLVIENRGSLCRGCVDAIDAAR